MLGRVRTPVAFKVRHTTWHVACALALYEAAAPGAALAQTVRPNNIVTDGRTATALSVSGTVTDVRTSTVSGANAYNSFSAFNVGQGQTVNLQVPTAASNLVNVVRDQRATVDGVLNSIKDGKIGGNVYFATPNGMLVSATGVVNVGSLTVTTPTREFTDTLFVAPGVPNQAAVTQLMSGNAPRNANAQVIIDGKVNSAGDIALRAGAINVGGTVYSGARFNGTTPRFTDVVNANGITSGTRVVERNGHIVIVADGDVQVSGTVAAPGSPGVRGGDISITAGNNVTLAAGAKVIASGDGANSPGGSISIYANNSAMAGKGALVDASAGTTGNGGSVEFSARNNIELAGTVFRADAMAGAKGKVLIDPASITVSADILRGASGYPATAGATVSGADITLKADDGITVNSDVTISSRLTAGDALTGASTGNSGNITLDAPSITLAGGSRLLAHADGAYTGGDVTLTANKNATTDIAGLRQADAVITIGEPNRGAIIKGRELTITATTLVDTRWVYSDGSWVDNATNIATTAADASMGVLASLVGVNVVHSEAVGNATIAVRGSSLLQATGTVTLHAENNTSAGTAPALSLDGDLSALGSLGGPGTLVSTPLGLGLMYSRNQSNASVSIEDSTTIQATNLTLRAHNNATLDAAIAAADAGRDKGTASLAIGVIMADVKANAVVGQNVNLKVSGAVSVAATNINVFGNSVESQTGSSGNAAAAVAVSDLKSSANAELRANIKDAASVEVLAINDNTSNHTTADTRVGDTILNMIAAGADQAIAPLTNPASFIENAIYARMSASQAPDAAPEQGPQSTKLRIGGAIVVTDSSADATASIGPNANIHASGQIVVAARTLGEEIKAAAESAAVSQSRDRAAADTARSAYSAGVVIANYTHNALAEVGSGATLTAQQIAVSADTVLPIREAVVAGGIFDGLDKWTALSTISDAYNALADGGSSSIYDVFNGVSAAKATNDNSGGATAFGGSVGYYTFGGAVRAVIDTGAKLNVLAGATGPWNYSFQVVPDDPTTADDESVSQDWSFASTAHVRAAQDTTLLFQGGPLIPVVGGSNSRSLGLAYTQSALNITVEAIVREGAVIQGATETVAGTDADGLRSFTLTAASADGFSVTADSRVFHLSLGASAGLGDSFGVNGSGSVAQTTLNTRALVDDEATVKADTFTVTATSTPIVWAIAGGLNYTKGDGVGIGIAYNEINTQTQAQIADNDSWQGERATARTSEANVTGAFNLGDVDVEARNAGHAETIAVTGSAAVSSNDTGNGVFDKITSGYNSVQNGLISLLNKLDASLLSKASGESNDITVGKASGPQGTKADPKFIMAGAGSAAANNADLSAGALIDGVTLDAGSVTTRGVADVDVVAAAGSAAIARAGKGTETRTAGLAGSVALNNIDSDTTALIRHSQISNTSATTVQALQGGEQLAIAIGAAVDATTSGSKTQSTLFAGSVSLTFVGNTVDASLSDTTLTGAATGAPTLDVTAYNRTLIGTGGGGLTLGLTGAKSTTAVGGAITWSEIGNTVNAAITDGSDISGVDAVTVRAYNATAISAGAAQTAILLSKSANSLSGAVVVTQIDNTTTAAISGDSTVTATGSVQVLAADTGADAAFENIIIAPADQTRFAKGIDYCGSGSAGLASPSGNCMVTVAGVLQINPNSKSSNAGASVNWNSISNNLIAKIEDAAVSATGKGGTITVSADSNATITALAVGAGEASGLSGAGSVALNTIRNNVSASVSAPRQDSAHKTLTADTITIHASDSSQISTLAGQLSISANSGAAGAAVTYADIANTLGASASGVAFEAPQSVAIGVINTSAISALAGAGVAVTSGAAPSLAGSVSINLIGNSNSATADNVSFDNNGGVGNNAITLSAADQSAIESLAGALSFGAKAAIGGAFAYNDIGNLTTAAADSSRFRHAGSIDIDAQQASSIDSISAGLASGSTALSGSVSINRTGRYGDSGDPDQDGNVTTARLKGSTVESASTDIGVSAQDRSSIRSLAGSVSSGTTAVGGAVADNSVRNVVLASIADSSLQGAGAISVGSTGNTSIQSLSAAGADGGTDAFSGSASSNRTTNRTIAEFADSEATGGTAATLISANDSATIQSLAGSAALAGTAAVGAAVAVNQIGNTTDARSSGVYTTGKGLDVQNLLVQATSKESIETIAASGSAGDVGIAGSVAINEIANDTLAHIDGKQQVESAQYVGVIAKSDDVLSVGAGSAGVGEALFGVGASVVVDSIDGSTRAWISDATVSARDAAGSPGLTVASGGLTQTPDLLTGITHAVDVFQRPDLAALRGTQTVHGLAVNASATHSMVTFVANVGAGEVGLAGGADVNTIGGLTSAYIDNATINGGNNSSARASQGVQVTAGDQAYASTFVGTVAVGATGGAGLMADVAVFDRSTSAYVQDSQVIARGAFGASAQSGQGMSSVAVAGAAGGFGVVGTGGVVQFTSDTGAYVTGSTLDVGSAEISASHDTHMFLAGGAIAGGATGVGGSFDAALDASVTQAYLQDTTVRSGGQVNVDAQSVADINTWTLSAGIGGVGVAGTAAVVMIENTTQAWLDNTTVGDKAARAAGLAVTAGNTVTVQQVAGAGALGLSVGAGVAAGVILVQDTVSAYLNNSNAYTSGDIALDAAATRDVATTVATAGGSANVGLSGAAGVVLIGRALDNSQSGDANATRELDDGNAGTLTQIQQLTGGDHLTRGQNLDAPSGYRPGLSDSDVAALNARTRLDVKGRVFNVTPAATTGEAFNPATDLDGRVAAISGGSATLNAQGGVRIAASEADRVSALTGAGALGIVGLGGAVAIAQVNNTVEAALLGNATVDAGSLSVSAEAGNLSGSSPAVSTKAVQAVGGAVGLGAAVAVSTLDNDVSAALGRGTSVTLSGGDASILASDSGSVSSSALGATAGLLAAGAIISRATHDGDTSARAGNTAPAVAGTDTRITLDNGNLTVQASRGGAVSADARGGAGGIIAGSGAEATATDAGSSSALIGNSVAVAAGGDVNVSADAAPQVFANTLGVAAGGVSIGVSLATATASDNVSASLGDNSTVTANNLAVTAQRSLAGGAPSAVAFANSPTAGAILGVNGSVSTAASGGTVTASTGSGVSLDVAGTAAINADSHTAQQADVRGITVGGVLALGAVIANATADTATRASTGNLLNANASTLSVNASGADSNTASATSGSGGLVSGAGAAVNTRNNATTSAGVGSGDATHVISVGALAVTAAQTNTYSGQVDSTNASAVGASGSVARHDVLSSVTTSVGDNAVVRANDVTLAADNTSREDWLFASTADAAQWNIRSGSGGIIDAAAASSIASVTLATAVNIGDGADIHILAPVAGVGHFNADAYNVIVGHVKAEVDSGGALPLPLAFSRVTVTSNAAVNVGSNASVVSDLGDIDAGASALVDIDVRANANAYGLAGQPAGQAYAEYTGNNAVTVNSGALLHADDGAIFLAAGQSSGGVQGSITAYGAVNLWNKTAAPLVVPPDPQALVTSNATVTLAGSAVVEAAGDISLLADKGAVSAKADGDGKDIYRETAGAIASGISSLFGGGDVSLDLTGSTVAVSGLAEVHVDGTVRTGIKRNQSLTFDYQLVDANGDPSATPVRDAVTGLVLWRLVPTASRGITFTVDLAQGIAQSIRDRIQKLQDLSAQYAGDAASVGAYQAEIKFLQAKLVELGYARTDSAGNIITGTNNPSPYKAAQQQLTLYNAQLANATARVTAAATTTASTAASASTAATTIATNAGTVTTQQATLATNDTAIDTQLKAAGSFNANNSSYTQLNSLRTANDTLRSEITTRVTANSTDRTTLTTKTGDVNTLLGQIATLNTQIDQVTRTNAADSNTQIATLRTQIDTLQTTVATRVAEVNTLLGSISTRNGEIKSRTDTLAANNTSIDALQVSLTTAFGANGSQTTAINTLRTANGTASTALGGARTTITTQQGLFSDASTGYVATVNLSNSSIISSEADKGTLPSLIADLTAQLPTLSTVAADGAIADFIKVNDITARLGNIYTAGDRLTGSGLLAAPGDANITVTNNTPDFLVLNKLTISADDGGALRFNGALVNANADIQGMNRGGTASLQVVTRDSQGATAPAITVTSNYDPNSPVYANLPAPAPDINLQGDITNLRGSVTVHSKAGSILSSGSVNAGTVDIKADNGDFVQSFVNGFFPVGGDPASIHDFGTPLGQGIIANGSVVISARYLNINSLVQSGIDTWTLSLPSNVTLTGPASLFGLTDSTISSLQGLYNLQTALGQHPATTLVITTAAGAVVYNYATQRFEFTTAWADADSKTAGWATRTASSNGLYSVVGDYGNIPVYYNPLATRLELNGTQVRGGYIQLYGQIINTSDNGAGKLRVLDGFGSIGITNESTLPLVVNNLDTGADPNGDLRGTAGKIDITDIRDTLSDGSIKVVHSVYTREYNTATQQYTVKGRGEGGTIDTRGVFTADGTTFGTSGGDRTGTYAPLGGQRYVWTTAVDSSTNTYWTFKSDTVFGAIEVTKPSGEVTSQQGPYINSSVRLADGTYVLKLGASAPSTRYLTSSQSVVTSDVYVKTGDRTACNWYSLCIAQYHFQDYTETSGTKTINTNSLKADYAIGIEFSGSDTGTLAVATAGNLLVNGTLNNRAGTVALRAGDSDTGVTSAGKSITQINTAAAVNASDLMLAASGGIGSDPANPLHIAIRGSLDAHADNGNLYVSQTAGDLKILTATAAGDATQGLGRVGLSAEGNILLDPSYSGSLLQGNRVDLTSVNGGIGSIAVPLVVNTGMPADPLARGYYGLTASAQGDIGIASGIWSGNLAGDLLLNTVVSRGGDVRLVAPGRIIDNNPIETIDTRTWNELLAYWDSMALRANTNANADKQAQTVLAFENGRTQDYRLYWQMRQRQADPSVYDPTFTYVATPAERDALSAAGYNAQQISTFEASRTAQYRNLNAEVGSLANGAYDASYSYTASAAEKSQLLQGSSWTERELGISLTPALLKDITNTNPVVKAANAQGRRVTLEAGTAIGETQAGIVIPTDIAPENLTDEQKVALASAERGDLDLSDPTRIVVTQKKPVNFDAATAFSASVTAAAGVADAGAIYLASLGNARIDAFSAAGDARIKVRGSIVNESDSSPALQAGNLILEAANGGIGYVPADGVQGALSQPLRLSLADGATFTARAGDNLSVTVPGNLNVDTAYSRGDVTLTAGNSILDAHAPFVAPGSTVRESDLNILGNNLFLLAHNGSIGTAGNALDVSINLTGSINASAASFGNGVGQGVYLNGPLGHNFTVGNVQSGDVVSIVAQGDFTLAGLLSGTGVLTLDAGGALTLTPNAAIHATTQGVFIAAHTLTMADGASIKADTGTIDIRTVGDAVITGIETGNSTGTAVTIVSSAGRILDGGDTRLDITADTGPGATLTLSGALGIGDDPLDVRVTNLQAQSGGVVDVAAQGSVHINAIDAAGRVLLSAGGDISGNKVTSSGIDSNPGSNPDHSVTVTSGGSVNLAAVSGSGPVTVGGQGVTLNTVSSSGGNVNLIAAGNVAVQTAMAGGDLNTTATSGSVNLSSGSAGGAMMLSGQQGVTATTLSSGGQGGIAANGGRGAVNVGTANATGDIGLSSQGNINAGTLASSQGAVNVTGGAGVALGSAQAGGNMTATAAGDLNVGSATSGGTMSLGGSSVAATTASAGGDLTITGTNGIQLGNGMSGGSASLASANGGIAAGALDATGSVMITAPGNIDVQQGTAGSSFNADSSAGSVHVASAAADSLTLAAFDAVNAGALTAGSAVTLLGDSVTAHVTAPDGTRTPTMVSITGYGGGNGGVPASNIQLTAANPAGFTFTDVLTALGGINIDLGNARFDNLLVVNQLTVTTPLTRLLIDQDNRSFQHYDVQLYSGGAPMTLSLAERQVNTSAAALFRGPLFDVTTPYGNVGSDEAAGQVLAAARLDGYAGVPVTTVTTAQGISLITFTGVPVALGDTLCLDNKNKECAR